MALVFLSSDLKCFMKQTEQHKLSSFHIRGVATQEKRISSWKESETVFLKSCTYSYSLRSEWVELSKNLPKLGMVLDSVCYPLLMFEEKYQVTKYWPTPTATDYFGRNYQVSGERLYLTLAGAAHLQNIDPQQTVGNLQEFKNTAQTLKQSVNNLMTMPELWPTSLSRNGKRNVVQGQLNPTWVEWLMGFPLLWSYADQNILMQLTDTKNHKISQ